MYDLKILCLGCSESVCYLVGSIVSVCIKLWTLLNFFIQQWRGVTWSVLILNCSRSEINRPILLRFPEKKQCFIMWRFFTEKKQLIQNFDFSTRRDFSNYNKIKKN